MRFLPLIGVMTLIFLLSHTPGSYMPKGTIFGQDKFWHILAYGALAAAALWACLPQVRVRPRPGLWSILLFCLLYGISDEYHQSFVPGRYPSLSDIGADFIGAGLFLWLWWLVMGKAMAGGLPDKKSGSPKGEPL